MSYTVVDVVPDTDEWLLERRKSVGASEVAAVMGLSQWATPLDVYKSKHGVDRPFDPLIALVGHEDERTMSAWLTKLSGLNPDLEPGFMARSDRYPFIHATPDRMWDGVPVQLKTAHEYTSHKWDEGIPTEYRIQVQTEMLVLGAPRALLVVRIGSRDFRAIWENRDDKFIEQHMIPALREFWDGVEAGIPPAPSTVAELTDQWHDSGAEMEADARVQEWIEKRAFLLATAKEAEEGAKKIQVELGQFMLEHNVERFTVGGKTLLTYKRQNGRATFDQKRLREDHPDIVAEYTTQGAPFMVMRTYKAKETKQWTGSGSLSSLSNR